MSTFETIDRAIPRIQNGALSPWDLVDEALQQITKLDAELHAFLLVREDDARAEAEAISGRALFKPLAGIPIAVKDNIETAGIATTAGSKVLADYVPTADATAWIRLKAAGAILVGKTNLHEFGLGATNLNSFSGDSRNPWDAERITGGSSGGSAVAVATGMAQGALGTDAGGSVRIPAALCGVVGLKQTHGLVPIRGGVAFGNPTTDHIGPMARSVVDVAILLQIMAGYDPEDPTSVSVSIPDYARAARHGAAARDLRGVRIGVPIDHFYDLVHVEVDSVVRTAVEQLRRLGATIEPIDLPDHGALVDGLTGLGAEMLAYHLPCMRTRLADYTEQTQVRLLARQFMLGSDNAYSVRARRLLCEVYARAFARVDMLVTPTVPIFAPTIPEARAEHIPMPNGTFVDTLVLNRNTIPANWTGLPAISIPCGFADGMPVGMQLIGRAFEESRLFEVAAAYEVSTEWHDQRPPGV